MAKSATKKPLRKAGDGGILSFFKKKEKPVDSVAYYNNAINYYDQLGKYRTAKGQTIEAAPAAFAERDKYQKKLDAYKSKIATSEANLKTVQQKGADKYIVEKKKKGGVVKTKRKR
jgi:hypothetical protein